MSNPKTIGELLAVASASMVASHKSVVAEDPIVGSTLDGRRPLVYSRFVVEADAREFRALLGIARRLAGKIARATAIEIGTAVPDRLRAGWSRVREDAGRGTRGWR